MPRSLQPLIPVAIVILAALGASRIPAATEAAPPTVDELRAAALDGADLGPGFRISSEFALRDGTGFVRNLDREVTITAREVAESGVIVGITLRTGEGLSPALVAEDYLRGPTAPLGHRMAEVTTRAAPGELGPDAIAMLLRFPIATASNPGAVGPVRAVLVWRSGDVVALVSYLHWGSADAAETTNQRHADLQRAKLSRVLGPTPTPQPTPSPPPMAPSDPEPAPPEG